MSMADGKLGGKRRQVGEGEKDGAVIMDAIYGRPGSHSKKGNTEAKCMMYVPCASEPGEGTQPCCRSFTRSKTGLLP